jgi:hypothetical protein
MCLTNEQWERKKREGITKFTPLLRRLNERRELSDLREEMHLTVYFPKDGTPDQLSFGHAVLYLTKEGLVIDKCAGGRYRVTDFEECAGMFFEGLYAPEIERIITDLQK